MAAPHRVIALVSAEAAQSCQIARLRTETTGGKGLHVVVPLPLGSGCRSVSFRASYFARGDGLRRAG
jgi:hypothetical protein